MRRRYGLGTGCVPLEPLTRVKSIAKERRGCRDAYRWIRAGLTEFDRVPWAVRFARFEHAAMRLDVVAPADAALWRARAALLQAHLAALLGHDSSPHAERAARFARGLRNDPRVAQYAVYGVLAEACVSLCANASTPRRALLYERGRRAALRALELHSECASAHYALGLQSLFTPEAFGGAPGGAIAHLERVLRRQPAHLGARMALAEAQARVGAGEACRRELARLRASAPALARQLERRLREPDS